MPFRGSQVVRCDGLMRGRRSSSERSVEIEGSHGGDVQGAGAGEDGHAQMLESRRVAY